MKTTIATTAVLAAALTVPAGAAADPSKPVDSRNAAKECKTERGTTDATRQAFAVKYGTNANDKNAFGKCVSEKAKEEHAERHAAKRSAQRDCRTERANDEDAFRQKYGTNKNKRNAFGKCVSKAAKKHKAKADQKDSQQAVERKNAAQSCDSERAQNEDAFEQKYGTNKSKRNAFGKCVSQTARSQ
jgi:hypothetical protein